MAKVRLELTRQEFYALFSLVNERFLDSQKQSFQGIDEWVDVPSGDIVTVQDLLVLLSREI